MKKLLIPMCAFGALLIAGCGTPSEQKGIQSAQTAYTKALSGNVMRDEVDVMTMIASYNNMHTWLAQQMIATGGNNAVKALSQKFMFHAMSISQDIKTLISSGVIQPIHATSVVLRKIDQDEKDVTGDMYTTHMMVEAYRDGIETLEEGKQYLHTQEIIDLYRKTLSLWKIDEMEISALHEALHHQK